jgi:hypothetical protein
LDSLIEIHFISLANSQAGSGTSSSGTDG